MRIFFLIFLLAYVGGNVYIFIRTLQMLSGFSLAMKILLSVVYWLVAFSLVIAMLTRHIDMPVILSKSMFHIGSVWLVFTLYMIFALLIADVTKIFVPSLNPVSIMRWERLAVCFCTVIIITVIRRSIRLMSSLISR